jgi:hypothetical protein
MNDIVRSLATFCCAVFFGAALYISLVQHTAALEAGNAIYRGYFPAMYRRAAVLQSGTAVLGFLAGIVAWRTSAQAHQVPRAGRQAAETTGSGVGSAASPSAARSRRTARGSVTAPRIRPGPPADHGRGGTRAKGSRCHAESPSRFTAAKIICQ